MDMDNDVNLVLADFSALVQRGNASALKAWTARYPEHAAELTRYALFRDVVTQLEPGLSDDLAAEQRLHDTEARVSVRLRAEGVGATAPTLESIVRAAAKQGLTPKALAEQLGLAISFVARLEQRLFVPASLPGALIRRLAASLNRASEEVMSFLSLPPRTSMAADYRAPEVPEIGEQIDFHECVAAALDLSEDQKAEWRSLDNRT